MDGSSQAQSSKPTRKKTSKSQADGLAESRTQAFVQEPAKNGNILATLPYQTTTVDNRRREMKIEMMDYIAGFNQDFHG